MFVFSIIFLSSFNFLVLGAFVFGMTLLFSPSITFSGNFHFNSNFVLNISIDRLAGEINPLQAKVGDKIPAGVRRNLDGTMIVKVSKS